MLYRALHRQKDGNRLSLYKQNESSQQFKDEHTSSFKEDYLPFENLVILENSILLCLLQEKINLLYLTGKIVLFYAVFNGRDLITYE